MKQVIVLLATCFYLDCGFGVEIESLRSALKATLGPIKSAAKKNVSHKKEKFDIYYDKATLTTFAVVQKRIYPPNCTHTWVIGVDAASFKVSGIRIIEYSCPHARPATKDSYFEQYKGKGPADVATLKDSVATIAKATGSCELTTDAVVTAIESVSILKKSL